MAALLCAWGLACGGDPGKPRTEVLPDMVDSVPYDAFAPNPNTRDGKTLMAPPRGAVPRGPLPFRFGTSKEEAERAGRELTNPYVDEAAVLARGEVIFQTFCYECHGREGKADGPVVPKFPPPPSLLADHARSLRDGQIFHIVTLGQGLMPPHAAQVEPDDRWRVARYIRKLQGGGK
jgi:mono/diheme cytochrome c family protein